MSDETNVKYENMLMSILQNEQKIEPFLDSIFNFLHKRTDLFLIQETPNQNYGFPNGVARNIVLRTFDKYDKLNKNKVKEKEKEKLDINSVVNNKIEDKKNTSPEQPAKSIISQAAGDAPVDENLKLKQDVFQSNPDSFNGAIRDNYSWTQSIKDIDVKINVNKNIVKSKDVSVKIEKQHLKVQVKSSTGGDWVNLIDDNLPWKIVVDECTWSLLPGDHVHVNLEKLEERWWENLIVSEEKLSVRNMRPEKPLHDLEPEAQAKIQQLMYDEQQKRLGKPTSEEQKNIDMLQQAWNAEGSPFAGLPFDPSVMNMQSPLSPPDL